MRTKITWNPWQFFVLLLAGIFILPTLAIVNSLFQPFGEVWQHLFDTVLQDYVLNSLWLMLGVAIGTLFIGVATAWLVTFCIFPGRKILEWALLLPLAFPAYIIAYSYTGMLDFAGPVQTTLRQWFAWSYGEYWFPEIRSLSGAIVMLSLVLYPYVYLLTRAAFLEQSVFSLEVSRSLGCTAWGSFWRVSLPSARPAIITGLSLALMETLADYGTVQYFGISTFTTGIFRTWFGWGNPIAAAQLSSLLLSFVFTLMLLERWSRKQARYHQSSSRLHPLPSYVLVGWRKFVVLIGLALVLVLGFVLPAVQLMVWTWQTRYMLNSEFFALIYHSILLASMAGVIALLFAVIMAYGYRLQPNKVIGIGLRMASMGYAIPGTIIAVGVMIPLSSLDHWLNACLQQYFNISVGLLLSGSLVALLFAYLVRFLAIALQTVEASLGKVKPVLDDSARILGHRPWEVLYKIHLPMIQGGLLTAVLLVFVDVMKELPATLILRPFNFNTLAVRAYELASDERLMESASAALAIVIAGIIPVFILSKNIANSRQRIE